MKFSLEHIGLPARDSAALAAWYEKTLGARRLWDNGQTPPTSLLALGDGAWLEIYPAQPGENPGRDNNQLSGFRHLALRVESIESARAELEQHGVVITENIRPAAGGGRVLFFADPDGNLLHLVERCGAVG